MKLETFEFILGVAGYKSNSLDQIQSPEEGSVSPYGSGWQWTNAYGCVLWHEGLWGYCFNDESIYGKGMTFAEAKADFHALTYDPFSNGCPEYLDS